MKLIMTLPVRNEEDILDTCIKYHLERGVDHIVAMDNMSTDGTLDILNVYEKQGLLTKLRSPDESYNQSLWVKRMGTVAIEMGAQWIINNDADEFWWPTGATLKGQLRKIPRNRQIAIADRWNFVPVNELPWLETHIYRDTESLNTFGRRILPKVCQRAHAGIYMKHGNHKALLNEEFLVPHKIQVEIFHFPIRGYQQLENKVKIGGGAYDSNPDLWRKTPILELYRLYKEEKLKDYYIQQLIGSELNQQRLSEGRIVKDIRLQTFMKPFIPDGFI